MACGHSSAPPNPCELNGHGQPTRLRPLGSFRGSARRLVVESAIKSVDRKSFESRVLRSPMLTCSVDMFCDRPPQLLLMCCWHVLHQSMLMTCSVTDLIHPHLILPPQTAPLDHPRWDPTTRCCEPSLGSELHHR